MRNKQNQLQFVVQTWASWPPIVAFDNIDLSNLQNGLLSSLPSHVKRRLSPLAKTVFCALLQCDGVNKKVPVVFSSCHGELSKSLDLIKLIEAGEEVSPTTFSLSVHNAIAGLVSIVFGNTSEITVLAPGEEGIASAFLETLGILAEGAPEVLVVFYDEPLPDFYPLEPFQLSSNTACALALQITQDGDGQAIQISRDSQSGYVGEQPVQLPFLIQFLSSDDRSLAFKTPRQSWHWEKTGINTANLQKKVSDTK